MLNSSKVLTVPPGESIEAEYAFPWEVLNHWGVDGAFPEDIGQVQIFTMEDGESPVYSFSPTGKKLQENTAGEPLVQGEDYAFSYLDSQVDAPCPISEGQWEPRYCMRFLLENNSAERRNYIFTVNSINGKDCVSIDCGTLEPACSTVIYVEVDYLHMGLSGKVVENAAFELSLQDNFGEPITSEEAEVQPNFLLP